jgi:hypothetical protein
MRWAGRPIRSFPFQINSKPRSLDSSGLPKRPWRGIHPRGLISESAEMCVYRDVGKVGLVRSATGPPGWQFQGGGVRCETLPPTSQVDRAGGAPGRMERDHRLHGRCRSGPDDRVRASPDQQCDHLDDGITVYKDVEAKEAPTTETLLSRRSRGRGKTRGAQGTRQG